MRYVKSCLTNIQKQQNKIKIAYLLRNSQTLQQNNLRLLRTKKVKVSGYCFYMNTNI